MSAGIRRILQGTSCLACALAISLFGLEGAVHAAVSEIIEITVQQGSDTGVWEMPLNPTPGLYQWSLSGPANIYSSTNPTDLLGTISSLTVAQDSDPNLQLNFAVVAGGAATTFTISSPTLSFAPLVNPSAFALANVTLIDNNGDGATMTGLFPGAKLYQAQYNSVSSIFANLVSPVTAAPDNLAGGSERFPAVGSTTIPGTVSNISSQFSFVLSALDQASGTSRFNVVPEPSTLVMAAIAAMGLLWHARRRLI